MFHIIMFKAVLLNCSKLFIPSKLSLMLNGPYLAQLNYDALLVFTNGVVIHVR
jgi:hypothetical protein